MLSKNDVDLLNQPFELSAEEIAYFQLNGYIKVKNVFPASIIQHFNDTISAEIGKLNLEVPLMENRDTYGKAFLQIMNLWTKSDAVKEIVFGKRLAKMATDLMQTNGVRLYHDQALFKEPGGGFTPWHADQYYWPLQTDKTVTVWIPLQAISLEMGPLEFSAKSQTLQDGRTYKISDDSETVIQEKLTLNDFEKTVSPFDIGEISFHMGWVFHRAGANTSKDLRKVMTIIYMDKDMTLMEPQNENQQADWVTWCPGAEIGKQIDSHLNPLLFSK